MSTPTLSRQAPGTAHDLAGAPVWDQQVLHKSFTLVVAGGLPEEVTTTLDSWGSELLFSRVAPPALPESEVAAVEYLQHVLGISQQAALRAVGVPKRTYHGWKGQGREPRERARARVWSMVRVISGLEATHENLAAWFHSSPQAQRAFRSGDPHELALIDLELASASDDVARPPVIPTASEGDASFYVRTDQVDSEDLGEVPFDSHKASS